MKSSSLLAELQTAANGSQSSGATISELDPKWLKALAIHFESTTEAYHDSSSSKPSQGHASTGQMMLQQRKQYLAITNR